MRNGLLCNNYPQRIFVYLMLVSLHLSTRVLHLSGWFYHLSRLPHLIRRGVSFIQVGLPLTVTRHRPVVCKYFIRRPLLSSKGRIIAGATHLFKSAHLSRWAFTFIWRAGHICISRRDIYPGGFYIYPSRLSTFVRILHLSKSWFRHFIWWLYIYLSRLIFVQVVLHVSKSNNICSSRS